MTVAVGTDLSNRSACVNYRFLDDFLFREVVHFDHLKTLGTAFLTRMRFPVLVVIISEFLK